jgi:hypothetical protein
MTPGSKVRIDGAWTAGQPETRTTPAGDAARAGIGGIGTYWRGGKRQREVWTRVLPVHATQRPATLHLLPLCRAELLLLLPATLRDRR